MTSDADIRCTRVTIPEISILKRTVSDDIVWAFCRSDPTGLTRSGTFESP